MSEVLSERDGAVARCTAAARELSQALKAADDAGLGLIDIIPPVLEVFREEGMSLDGMAIPGLLG